MITKRRRRERVRQESGFSKGAQVWAGRRPRNSRCVLGIRAYGKSLSRKSVFLCRRLGCSGHRFLYSFISHSYRFPCFFSHTTRACSMPGQALTFLAAIEGQFVVDSPRLRLVPLRLSPAGRTRVLLRRRVRRPLPAPRTASWRPGDLRPESGVPPAGTAAPRAGPGAGCGWRAGRNAGTRPPSRVANRAAELRVGLAWPLQILPRDLRAFARGRTRACVLASGCGRRKSNR